MSNQNENIIKGFLKNELNLTDTRVLQEYSGISKYPDIEQEFVDYIKNRWQDDTQHMIEVEGFDAKQLYERFSLSVLGAYNYLIFLREEPREALSFLREGLPRE